jgi:hypothetical protein
MASGGVLGFGLLGGSGGTGTGILSGLTSGGGMLSTLTAPIQKRLTAIQGAGTIQAKLQGALAASPIGARLKGLGLGTGTGTMARPLRHYAQPYAPTATPNARNPNNNFLSHF